MQHDRPSPSTKPTDSPRSRGQAIDPQTACSALVGSFVRKQLTADEFLLSFFAKWPDVRSAGGSGVPSSTGRMTQLQSNSYGVLASINGLCEAYSSSLPSGAGYRVSEEQFRQEVQHLARRPCASLSDRSP